MTQEIVLQWLGPVVLGGLGGFLTSVFLLPSKWGEALIKTRFYKALEQFKSDQAKEVEHLKGLVAHLGDRGKRSNELEFSAIEAIWGKLVDAYLSTGACVVQFVEFPNLNAMSADELQVFLESADFSKQQVDQVIQAADHNDLFVKVMHWRNIARAGGDVFEARVLLRKRRIFLPEYIRAEFSSALEFAHAAQVERSLAQQHPSIPTGSWGDAGKNFILQSDTRLDALAVTVNKRLFELIPGTGT